VTRNEIARRLAAIYDRRPLQEYARWKVRADPAYGATFEQLRGRNEPLVDLGCGVGLLAFFLRELGYEAPILGIDFDRRKIEVARRAARQFRAIEFIVGDARDPLPENHNVVMLDMLQYFDDAAQQRILANVARVIPPGGVVVIRQGIRDGSWRHRLTVIVDALARAIRWMKAESLNFPTREQIAAAFDGFESEIRPLWGRTPYNNYLFVFRRSSSGTTNE
jgi:SAM-dependent methyltransferase